MASFPPKPSVPQRQHSSLPENEASLDNRRSSYSQSATSVDSQTLLLNSPHSPSASPAREEHKEKLLVEREVQASIPEPRKCWICFADETEDTPTSSAWRSPCPCALTAHESCLLDWVADLEEPSRRRRAAPSKIQCPQCKADIKIARPRSLVVEGMNAMERVTGRLVVPGIVLTLAGTFFAGCWAHGHSTVNIIFGSEDAERLLEIDGAQGGYISSRWGIGLPIIPVVLILSRTKLADNILPVLPVLFFATQVPDGQFTGSLWPPSAAMTVASLPYIRGFYNELYRQTFAERERRWLKEVQPRAGDSGSDNEAGQPQDDNDNDIGGIAGIELDVQIWPDEEDEHHHHHHHPNPAGPPDQEAGQAGAGQEGQGQNEANPEADQAQGHQDPLRQNNMIVSTSRLADTVIGALMFPTISAAMGAVLKLSFPRRWTTPVGSSEVHRAGLLQTRWGRSIVGGCLFVVLKDALLLYSRYRLAQNHRKRRVLDYDGKRGKGVGR
ncbi:hypothetical protein MMC20_002581 [Loxospora ochrophaea]|nr:hypothetical protein [Loxospora ochrophaea]